MGQFIFVGAKMHNMWCIAYVLLQFCRRFISTSSYIYECTIDELNLKIAMTTICTHADILIIWYYSTINYNNNWKPHWIIIIIIDSTLLTAIFISRVHKFSTWIFSHNKIIIRATFLGPSNKMNTIHVWEYVFCTNLMLRFERLYSFSTNFIQYFVVLLINELYKIILNIFLLETKNGGI